MEERNKVIFQFNQDNQFYTITTSLIHDKINLVCKDSNSKIYENNFSLPELLKLSKYFQPNHSIEQIQLYLNGIIEKRKIGINQGDEALSLNLHLINNDQISIPLLKKFDNREYINYQYPAYNTMTHTNQYIVNQNIIPNPNNVLKSQPKNYYSKNSGNIQINPIQQQQKKIIQSSPSLVGYQYPKADTSTIQSYSLDENKISSLENENKMIKAGQEKLKNDLKRLMQEITKLKEQNEVYKVDHNSLTNENALLKNESDNCKKQIMIFQNQNKALLEENNIIKKQIERYKTLVEENNILKKQKEGYVSLIEENNMLKKQSVGYANLIEENNKLKNQSVGYTGLIEENNMLKKQIEGLNKDLDAVENQNDEIRKMYEELENEYNQYKSQTEEINKENELLREQIEELNNNFTMINKGLENIRNENEVFKSNLEQQKKNLNEDVVNRLIEENNILKKKEEENEYLKKQIEELQYQIQMKEKEEERETRENQIEERENQGEEEEEEKGEIIHDMKELELITNKINHGSKKIIINLLYKASVDGDKASVFHEKCDQAKSTIVLVETLNGKRFGGFTTCSWEGNCEDKTDPQAFIFSLDKMETYDNIPGDEAIGCYPKFGPIFLGCQIKIFDNAFTKGGTTFEKELNFNTKEDYELTGGDRVFQIKDIEVYEVIIE